MRGRAWRCATKGDDDDDCDGCEDVRGDVRREGDAAAKDDAAVGERRFVYIFS